MNSFDYILLLQAVLVLILAGTVCFAVWRACKAGGRVRVGFIVDVRWGGGGQRTEDRRRKTGGGENE